jgi:L-fuconolactonase
MRRIDAHQHFWRLDRGDYGWLTPALGVIHRDFMPDDLAPLLKRARIDGTVLVQAAPTNAETDFMLALAEHHGFIEGVVGWVDFGDAMASERIAAISLHPKLKGLRPMIQDIADPGWMLRPDLDPAYRALVKAGLVFDALVLPRHLDNLLTLVGRYPDMKVVVDHCAKPPIADGDFDSWAVDMAAIARGSKAACKLSGLVTEASADWTLEQLKPYVDHVLAEFGPRRVIWGSDWPVCTLAASYDRWIEVTDRVIDGCDSDERAAILGGNAIETYSLGNSPARL